MAKKSQAARIEITSGASFGIRTGARFLDVVWGFFLGIGVGIFVGVVLALLEMRGLIDAGWKDRLRGFDFWGLLLSLVGGLLYHSFTEGIYGASLGKVICGLRVVTPEGIPCGMKSAFQRSLAYLWDSFFFGLVAYQSMKKTPLNQRYGDHWAGTLVIPAAEIPEESRQPALVFFLSLVLGSAFWILLLAAGMALKVLGK